MKRLALITALLLSGCAHKPAPGAVVIYWDDAVAAQCHDQPKLDWCRHAKR